MAPITIALNIAFVAFVLIAIVGLHARAVWLSRHEAAAQPRRAHTRPQPAHTRTQPAHTRTQPARRLASVNG